MLRLLQKDANRYAIDILHRTPVEIARESGYNDIGHILEADPRLLHVHDMCELGKLQLVHALIKQGCPVNYRDERPGKFGQTPLIAAAHGQQLGVVQYLLRIEEVVRCVDLADSAGRTALMRAARVSIALFWFGLF